MTSHKVHYGDGTINFAVFRQNALSGKIVIHIEPDGRVVVGAPTDTTLTAIKQAVSKRARWVNEQIESAGVRLRDVLPRKYVSGETHWYLGKRYMLKVNIAPTQSPSTKLSRGLLKVTVPQYQKEVVHAQLDAWFYSRATDVFNRRLDAIFPALAWVKQKPVLQLRRMNKQWGSCSPKGRLSLNPLLVKAPRQCIDYVIIHELCHLKFHDHSEQFYRLLQRQLPHWKAVKSWLDGHSELILNK